MQLKADAMITFAETDADKIVGYMDMNNEDFIWSGDVGIGTTAPNGTIHVLGGSSLFEKTDANPQAHELDFIKSRSNGIVQQDDNIAVFDFRGNDGVTHQRAAMIQAEVDGVPGAGDMPGRLTFFTTPVGSVVSQERMRINSSGNVGIGTETPGAKLTVNSTGGDGLSVIDSTSPRFQLRRDATNEWYMVATPAGANNLEFRPGNIAGTSALTMTTARNVGIGTTSPSRRFQVVASTGSLSQSVSIDGFSSVLNTDVSGLMSGSDFGGLIEGGSVGHLAFAVKDNDIRDGFAFISGGGDYNSDSTYDKLIMKINANGNVGIGTNDPVYELHVVGDAGKSTGTSWINTSDRRLKDIKGSYEYGLDEILKLNTVRFNYKKNNPLGLPSDKEVVGFIAQEVKDVIPEAVKMREHGYYELNVDPIHWASVNAIQDLYDMCKATDEDFIKIKELVDKNTRNISSVKSELKDQSVQIESLKEQNKKLMDENKELKLRLEKIEKALFQK